MGKAAIIAPSIILQWEPNNDRVNYVYVYIHEDYIQINYVGS